MLPLNKTIHIGDDGLAETNLTLSNVTLQGLDMLNPRGLNVPAKIFGASPPVDYQLATSLSLPRLVVTADAIMSLAPSSIVGKGRHARLASIMWTEIDIDLDLLLAFDHPFSALQLGKCWSYVPCWSAGGRQRV